MLPELPSRRIFFFFFSLYLDDRAIAEGSRERIIPYLVKIEREPLTSSIQTGWKQLIETRRGFFEGTLPAWSAVSSLVMRECSLPSSVSRPLDLRIGDFYKMTCATWGWEMGSWQTGSEKVPIPHQLIRKPGSFRSILLSFYPPVGVMGLANLSTLCWQPQP